MPSRRLVVPVLLLLGLGAVVAVLLTGLRTSTAEAPAVKSPAAEALAYVPLDSPAVAVVATDGRHGLARLAQRFPAARLAVARAGVDASVLATLAGNDVVIAATSVQRLRPQLQLSAVSSDEGALHDAVAAQADRGTLTKVGTARGAQLYAAGAAGAAALAVRGPVLVAGRNVTALRRALELRAAGRGALTPARLDRRLRGLPSGALVRVAGNAETILSGAAPRLRSLPLVRALRRFAATIQLVPEGLRMRARIAADSQAVGVADLPLSPVPGRSLNPPAASAGAPGLAVRVRDPGQLARFALRAMSTLAPKAAGPLQQATGLLQTLGGLDLDADVIGHLVGPGTLTSDDLRTGTVRTAATDSTGLAGTLGRLQTVLSFAPGVPVDITDEDGDLYSVQQDGRFVARFGLAADGDFVVTTEPDGPALRAPAPSLHGPGGDAAGRLRADALREVIIRALGLPGFTRLALAPLGDLTFGVDAGRNRIDADVRLVLVR